MRHRYTPIPLALLGLPLLLTLACGGGGSSTTATANTGTVSLALTDAPSEDWSEVGVILRKATLVPQGGTVSTGTVIYDGSSSTTSLNLVDLDSLSELISSTQVPAGTYTRLVLEVDAAPADITLVPADGSGQIPSSQIKVLGADSATGLATVPVTLDTPLVVSAGQPTVVEADFDLGHPLFIVPHDTGSTPVYCIDFQVRQAVVSALEALNQRWTSGQVLSVASDAGSFSVETPYGSDRSFKSTGTLRTVFFNLDSDPAQATASFSVPSTLNAGKYVRVAARFQSDGTQKARRVWYASSAATLVNAYREGHVVKVDTDSKLLYVRGSDAVVQAWRIDADTAYYLQGGSTAIATGTDFLSSVGRGFKVAVSAADPSTNPPVAGTVDIQRAAYEGRITAADSSSLTFTHTYSDATLSRSAGYGSSFAWWTFAHPGTTSTDQAAFLTQALPTSGPASRAASTLDWGGSQWAADSAVFLPVGLGTGVQTLTTGYANGSLALSYTPEDSDTAQSLTVNLGTTAQDATVVTEYTNASGVVTVQVLDSTSAWAAALTAGAKVRVYGIPKGDGSLDAYWINLFD
nr:DUF4382 domain-containing protein [uncultured Holophaga sp.]